MATLCQATLSFWESVALPDKENQKEELDFRLVSSDSR